MHIDSRIYVAGHRGLVGSAISRTLRALGHDRLIERTRAELDLKDQAGVLRLFETERPEYVFFAATKVGGILANATYPADFIRSNLIIQLNLITAAHLTGVKKFLFLGSSCIYPKFAPQPIPESALLTSELEPTNQPYAIAKIAGIELCQAYHRQYGMNAISVMPTNLYGPGGKFDLNNAHVLPALMHRFHDAKLKGLPEVTVWETGTPRREFLHVDDLAHACVFLMEQYDDPAIINIGYGEDVSIAEAAELVKEVVGYPGEIVFDSPKPDGTPRKLLDVSRLRGMAWRPRVKLRDGVIETYRWYLDHVTERDLEQRASQRESSGMLGVTFSLVDSNQESPATSC